MSDKSLPHTTEQRAAEYINDPKFQQALQQKRKVESLVEVLWRYEAVKRVDRAMMMDLKEELQKFVRNFMPKLDEIRQKSLEETTESLTEMTTEEDLVRSDKLGLRSNNANVLL